MFTYKTVTARKGSFVICAGATQLPGLISPASLKRLGKTTTYVHYDTGRHRRLSQAITFINNHP